MIKETVGRSVPENGNSLFWALNEPPDKSVICELINSTELFIFTLAYREPPEDFGELIRYRQELDLAAGRKNNYTGDVLIDLTNWIGSEDSDYLDAFLAYLYDNASNGRYIFTVECNNCKAMENKISEYFCVEKKQLDLCTGELLRKHIEQYLKNRNCRISSKSLTSLCSLFEIYAKERKISMRNLEALCDRLISHSNDQILDNAMIKEFIEPEINMRLGDFPPLLFGIGSKDERS